MHQQFAVAMSLVLLVASLVIVGAVTALLAWSRSALSGVSKSLVAPPEDRSRSSAQTRSPKTPSTTQGVLR